MRAIRKWIRGMFGFSRTETNGLIILLPLMGVLLFSMPLYRWISRGPSEIPVETQDILESIVKQLDEAKGTDSLYSKRKEYPQKQIAATLFPFDPNEASPETLQRLGFSAKLSTRIANYRNKGGQFRVKTDVLKIYGMDSAFYRRVSPFLLLPDKHENTRATTHIEVERIRKTRIRFDINTADSAQLKSVFGIGEKLSARILKYRDRLGGFVRMEQLNEVYGLDTVVVNSLQKVSFVDENFTPNLLNINTLTEKELSSHPYISKAIAKAIVAYRFQHGDFKGMEDLRKVHILNQEDLDRVIPYLMRLESQ